MPPGVIEQGLLLKMRFDLDLYISQRPFLDADSGIDMVVIRENTEGPYVGEGGVLRRHAHEVATQGSVNTRMGVERCVRYAFELAEAHSRKHLTLVHKTNVLTFADDLAARSTRWRPSTRTWARPTATWTPPASTSCPTPSATTWS